MATKDKKKKPASPLMYVIVAIMAAVLIYQNLVPTNMAAVYDNNVNNAVMITCTRVGGGPVESESFSTENPDKIQAFIDWGAKKKMRIRSLADGITAAGAQVVKYNFAIKQQDGTYQQFVIDNRGYFHVGAEIYKFAGNMEDTCDELEGILQAWKMDDDESGMGDVV